MNNNNLRSIIPIVICLLAGLWYGASWLYKTQYKEPRDTQQKRIDEYKQQIELGTRNLATMRQVVAASQVLYARSLPRQANDARSQYQFWLLELVKFCDLSQPAVETLAPTRISIGNQYRFQVRGRGSLEQVTLLLYQFYWAPFLQRVSMMSITPVENSELVDVTLTIDAITIPPASPTSLFPLADKLPTGYQKRLASNPFSTYRLIADRNLLQHTRGGIDKADHTYLTSIQRIDDAPLVWLTDRTTGNITKATIGQKIEAGSFRGTLLSVDGRDIVIERGGILWLLSGGESLKDAYAIPKEAKPPVE
ncbi:MAG: hypothetical protein LBU65_13305 [Planctomycetaceae bacterium]|jgi:hypothetical protein|nr:hypothetical protein [Planctomycetaceae bacterium]